MPSMASETSNTGPVLWTKRKKWDVVVRRLRACLAPSTLVEGRDETRRSLMKLCADDDVASRRFDMDATMEAAAEVDCASCGPALPFAGLAIVLSGC